MPHRNILSYLNPATSISARIGMGITIIAVILSVGSSWLMGEKARRNANRAIGASLAEIAYQTADKLERGMFERYQEIQAMAEWPVLTSERFHATEKRRILEGMKARYPLHAWIGLTDAEGNVMAGTDGLLEGKNVSARPWFSGGSEGPYVGDVHGALLLARYLPAPPDGNLRFVDVAAPVYSPDGRFLGVLCSHLNWEWAGEVKQSTIHEAEEEFGVDLVILSSTGAFLLGPPSMKDIDLKPVHEAFAGIVGRRSAIMQWPDDGGQYLTGAAMAGGYRDYPGLGWLVLAREPVDIAFASANGLEREIVQLGVGTGLILAVVGWMIAFHFSVPVLRLARVATRIHQGEHAVTVPVSRRSDEVGALTRSISGMLDTLRAQNAELAAARDSLEERVRERTGELEASNAELRRSERHLSEAQRLGLVGSLELNTATGEEYWSEQMYRLLGCEPGVTTLTLDLLAGAIHEDDRMAFDEFMKREHAEPEEFEARVVGLDRVERDCLFRATRLATGEGAGSVRIALTDITARKREERLRTDVDLIMRHDLKGPLNAVINYPEIMAEDENLTDEQREYLFYIQQSGLLMMNQINESLNLYKMENGTYRADHGPVDLIRLLRLVGQGTTAIAQSRRVTVSALLGGRPVEPGQEVVVPGDDQLFYSMMTNLVKNAIEASPKEAPVTIELSQDEAGVSVSIHNLSAVPVEVRETFFRKFSTHGKKGGTGLGNYSARLIAETHGGTITMNTSEESGTTVTVRLPL